MLSNEVLINNVCISHYLLRFMYRDDNICNIYHFICFPVLAISALSTMVVLGSVSASRVLHSSMLHKIVQCPMSFFDTTPLGRILNRFSRDVDIMDTKIQQYLLNLFMIGGSLLTTFIIILYTMPILFAVIIPLAVIFGFLQVNSTMW